MTIAEKVTALSVNNKTIAENEQKVYDAGYAKGKAEGGDRSFANSLIDRSITKLTADNLRDLTFIGADAFLECYWLKEVELPDNITMIKYWAFRHCSKLPEIIIPPKLTLIGVAAFYGCSALRIVDLTRFGTNNPFPTLESVNVFENVSDIFQIVVPYGRKSELNAMTNWSAFPISTEAECYGKGVWRLNDWIKNSTPSTEYNIYFFDANGNYYEAIRIHPFDEMTGVSIDFGYDGTWKNVYFDGIWEDGAQTLDLFNFINLSTDEAEEVYRWLLNNATRLGDSENIQ